MGSECMEAVVKGLAGVDVSGPWGDKGKTASLNGNAFALLVAVAFRQPNAGFRGDPKPICLYRKQDLLATTHMTADTLERARNFLVKSGILSYEKKTRHKDINGSNCEVMYENVYRIDLQTIARLGANHRLQAACGPAAKSGSPAAKSGSPAANSGSPAANSGSSAANSGCYIDNNNIREPNTTTDTDSGSGSNFQEDILARQARIQREQLQALAHAIAQVCKTQIDHVNLDALRKAVRGKDSRTLVNATYEIGRRMEKCFQKKEPFERISLLVHNLKQVPPAQKMNCEKENDGFLPPQPIPLREGGCLHEIASPEGQ